MTRMTNLDKDPGLGSANERSGEATPENVRKAFLALIPAGREGGVSYINTEKIPEDTDPQYAPYTVVAMDSDGSFRMGDFYRSPQGQPTMERSTYEIGDTDIEARVEPPVNVATWPPQLVRPERYTLSWGQLNNLHSKLTNPNLRPREEVLFGPLEAAA